jgi:hypothetical protein
MAGHAQQMQGPGMVGLLAQDVAVEGGRLTGMPRLMATNGRREDWFAISPLRTEKNASALATGTFESTAPTCGPDCSKRKT